MRADLLSLMSSATGPAGSRAVRRLRDTEVLIVDCQATGAAPAGNLLEIGWTVAGRWALPTRSNLITLPVGHRIPPAVTRITGISDRMLRDAVDARHAWRALARDAAALRDQPAPTVIHFARFEKSFLRSVAGDVPALDIVCTHEIARRILPELPRCSLRALAGYFGRAVGPLRRCADHVEATVFVWRELLRLLEGQGIATWSALHDWLAAPTVRCPQSRRAWPMPREVRLALPDAPGVYRMLRINGDVLYVGKANSLRKRVNSHFRHRHGLADRALEMLSQARAISYEASPTALEAALLEADEIKLHHPPYNVALTLGDRDIWFTLPDLTQRSRHASARHCVGPFPSAELLEQFVALTRKDPGALGSGKWAPEESVFQAGYHQLCAVRPEVSGADGPTAGTLLRLGGRLWREGRRDRDESDHEDVIAAGRGLGFDLELKPDATASPGWTPELVQLSIERLALRMALAGRRARWLTSLMDAAVVWMEPGGARARMMVIEAGEIIERQDVAADAVPPLPPGHRKSAAERRAAFTVTRFDRLRVLTTEFKRLSAAGAGVSVRFGGAAVLAGGRFVSALSWV